MAEKDKVAAPQPKNIPKDGQVITSIMKEMGITDYEPKIVVQLTEFVFRFATSILEEARMYANNFDKETPDVEHVRLALQLTSESQFTSPPPREVILECANVKNYNPLPLVKPHCGLRLPPDRHCLSSSNFMFKSSNQRKNKVSYGGQGVGAMKVTSKANISYVKRPPMGLTKQTVAVPKPMTKITANPGIVKTTLKPKIQIAAHNVHIATSNGVVSPMEIENSLKRKREDDIEI